MGGYGSGRKAGFACHFRTNDCIKIDVRQLKRENMLTPGSSRTLCWTDTIGRIHYEIRMKAENAEIWLEDVIKSDVTPDQLVTYPIPITTTKTAYGGERVWFLCPSINCNRRVAILYKRGWFLCRHCQELTYLSQNGGKEGSIASRLWYLRRRLGWDGELLDGPQWHRKKGMHRSTYERLATEYLLLDEKLNKLCPYRD